MNRGRVDQDKNVRFEESKLLGTAARSKTPIHENGILRGARSLSV
jgi:hypothetical protein